MLCRSNWSAVAWSNDTPLALLNPPFFLSPPPSSTRFRWHTDRPHNIVIRIPRINTEVPLNNSNSTVTSSTRGMAVTPILNTMARTTMRRTIRMAAITTNNRIKPMSRGDTINTPEPLDIQMMWIEAPRARSVTHRPHHPRSISRAQRHMSTMTRWLKLDPEGNSPARELLSTCISFTDH